MNDPGNGGRRCSCCQQHDAGHRHACTHCVTTMRGWLRDLEDYADVLAASLAPTPTGPRTGSIGSSFGSRPPINTDIATFLDYRSGAGAAVWRLRDPRDMDDQPIRSLPGAIHGIAAWLRDENDQTQPTTWDLASELRYLRGQIDACAIESWINEIYDDLRELHHQARGFAHDVPRSLGHCLTTTCEGRVYWLRARRSQEPRDEDPGDQARCVNCRRIYTGLDLVRLGAAEEAACGTSSSTKPAGPSSTGRPSRTSPAGPSTRSGRDAPSPNAATDAPSTTSNKRRPSSTVSRRAVDAP